MANVFIENYRGFDIVFMTDSERFSYSIDTGSWTQKQSYAACKKSIDDFLKTNTSFEPFKVWLWSIGKVYEIVGLRKDNRFIYINECGEKEQISEYNEDMYCLFDEADDVHYARIDVLEFKIEELHKEIGEERRKVKRPTLQEIKRKILNK